MIPDRTGQVWEGLNGDLDVALFDVRNGKRLETCKEAASPVNPLHYELLEREGG